MDRSLGTITTYAKLDIAGVLKGVSGAKVALGQFAADLKKNAADPVHQLARDMGSKMTLAGAGIAGGLGVAVKAAGEFDQSMRNTNSLLKLSEGQYQDLKKSILELTEDPRIRQGPDDLAKGMYDVASSGFQGKEALEVLRQSAYGASAGMTQTTTSSKVLMAVLNSGIGGVHSAREAMDVLFREVDLGVNTFEQLANSLGNVLPTAKVAGVSLQEVAAALAAMTRRGINVEESITALNNLMTQLIKPHKEAKKILDELGISYGLNGLQAKGLTGILQEMAEQTGANKQKLIEAMPEIRALKAMLSLTDQQGRQYTDMLHGMRTATDGVGATQKALTEQNKGASAQYEMLMKDVKSLGIQIGDVLLPHTRGLVNTARDAVHWFSKLPDPVKSSTVEIAAIGAVALVAAGSVLTLTTRLIELRTALQGSMLGRLGPIAGLVAGGYAGLKGIFGDMEGAIDRGNRDSWNASGGLSAATQKARTIAAIRKEIAGNSKFLADPTNGGMFATPPSDVVNRLRQRQQKLIADLAALTTDQAVRASGGGVHVGGGGGLGGGGGGGSSREDGSREQERLNARKQVLTDIYDLMHGEYDQRRRQAREELQDALDSGVQRVEAERRYRLQIAQIAREEASERRNSMTEALGDELKQQQEMIAQANANRKEIDAEVAANADREMEIIDKQVEGFLELGRTVSKAKEALNGFGAAFGNAFKTAEYYQNETKLTSIFLQIAGQAEQFGAKTTVVDNMKKQFNFMKTFAESLGDEFYSGFSQGLEKVFGRNRVGRALSRSIDKWFSSALDDMLGSLFGDNGNMSEKLPGQKRYGGLVGGILGSLFGGGIGGGIGSMLGGLLGFADGGVAPARRWSLVGERGPELIMPEQAMRVVPMQGLAMAGAGGGGTNIGDIHVHLGHVVVRDEADIPGVAYQLAWHLRQQFRAEVGS